MYISICIYEGFSKLVGRGRKNSTDNDNGGVSSVDNSPERKSSITGGDDKYFLISLIDVNLYSNIYI
jgi:hypothetical protein